MSEPVTLASVDVERLVANEQDRNVYNYYFDMCDIHRGARVNPLEAALLLRRSLLSDNVLRQIWDLVDPDQIGWLDRKRFIVALKLVAVCQREKGNPSLQKASDYATKAPDLGPLPTPVPQYRLNWSKLMQAEAEFIRLATESQGKWLVKCGGDGPSSDRNQFCAKLLQVPALLDPFAPVEARFRDQFRRLAVDNRISGTQCKQFMCGSGVSNDTLARIWSACDRKCEGSLDENGFVMAMRMVQIADRTCNLGMLPVVDNKSTTEKLRDQVDSFEDENKQLQANLGALRTRVVERRSELSRLESEVDLMMRRASELNSARCDCESKLERSRTRTDDLSKQVGEVLQKIHQVDNEIEEKNSRIAIIGEETRDKHNRDLSVREQIATVRSKKAAIEARSAGQRKQLSSYESEIQALLKIQEEEEKNSKRLNDLSSRLDEASALVESGSLAEAQVALNDCFRMKKALTGDTTEAVGKQIEQRSKTPGPDRTTPLVTQQVRAKSALDFTLGEFDPF